MTLISRRPDTPARRARNNRANRHEPTWASIFHQEEDTARGGGATPLVIAPRRHFVTALAR